MSVKGLFIDFETYSELDIKVVGAERYLRHPSARPLCMSFSLDGVPASIWVNTWFHSKPESVLSTYKVYQDMPKRRSLEILPSEVINALRDPELKVYAHNALFDFRVWNYLCVRLFGWPQLRLEQMEDTMAICQYMSLPASLDKAGEALGAATQKTAGTRLINLTCSPQPVKEKRVVTSYRKPDLFDARDTQNFIGLFEYCINDTDTLVAILDALPCKQLPAREKEIWLMTAEINLKGLPVRKEEIDAINTRLDSFQKEKKDELLKLTGGKLYSGSQYAAIKEYCDSLGYSIDNCQGDYLAEKVGDPEMPEHIRSVLSIVLVLGKSSTAKFRKIQDHMVPCETYGDYVARDAFCYHGASTGRWSGRGIQPQNFPKYTTRFPEDDMGFFTLSLPIKDPMLMSKGLLRPSICAPEGHCIIAADFSAIENIVLSWMAGDEETLEVFRSGKKLYYIMACEVFGGDYDSLKALKEAGDPEANKKYDIGKALVLACGFGMGHKLFKFKIKTDFGMDITIEESKKYVEAYRSKYHINVKFWYGLKDMVIRAIMSGLPQSCQSVKAIVAEYHKMKWLIVTLPNGKKLFYMNPEVEERHIPGYEKMGKVSSPTYEGYGAPEGKTTKVWGRWALTPGRLAENVVQATSREIMAEGMLNVRGRMKGDVELRGTVHDEAIGICPEGRPELLGQMIKHLCDVPWAVGCPIKAAGYISKRYKKQ